MTNNLLLEKQLCFRLYSLNKLMNRHYNPVLKELNLTYPQYLVMLVLWQTNDVISVKTLCDKLDLDSGTLSPLLKRLEKSQLLSRKRGEKDERSVLIKLSQKGKELKNKAQHVPEKMFAITGLQPEQLQSLNQQLDQLLADMSD